MGKNQRHASELKKGILLPVLLTLPVLGLMVRQQDYGTTAILLAILFSLLFIAGTRMIYLGPTLILGFAGLAAYAAPAAALEIKRSVLSNGAVLLVSEQHQLPMVTMSIAFDAGTRRDPEGKA